MDDYFLKIDGIPGESQDAKHKQEIELASFSWGVSEPGAGAGSAAGAAAGKAKFQDFHFVMRVNKASPQLFLATVSGKHIKEASLTVRKAGKQQLEYLKIKFSDVFVTSFEQASGEQPQESIAFSFGKVELQYTAQQKKGAAGPPITAGWDLSKNAKL